MIVYSVKFTKSGTTGYQLMDNQLNALGLYNADGSVNNSPGDYFTVDDGGNQVVGIAVPPPWAATASQTNLNTGIWVAPVVVVVNQLGKGGT